MRYRDPQAWIAPRWDDFWWNTCYLIRRHILIGVQENIPKLGNRVLDFGCGSKPYQRYFAGHEYFGVDIAVSGHDHATSHVDLFYDGHKLDLPTASFDAVLATEVMEHLFNYDELLPELWRVLRPGGFLLVTTPFAWPEHEKPYDYARYSGFGLTALLERYGFENVLLERRGHPFEVLCQLALTYAAEKIVLPTAYLCRFSVFSWCTVLNLTALLGRAVLPSWPDLYLSNLALAQKPPAQPPP